MALERYDVTVNLEFATMGIMLTKEEIFEKANIAEILKTPQSQSYWRKIV